MHIVANIFFIFIFLFAIFYFKFPNLENDCYLILHKFILFLCLFCFQFIALTLSMIKNKCKINVVSIAYDSLLVAVSGVIGYSIYNDLRYSGVTIRFFNMKENDPKSMYVTATIIITLFISFIKIIKLMINPKSLECIKY